MTDIERKAKAYDELFAKAKTMMVENTNEVDGAKILTKLFPQLAESEDEKIRKELLNYLYEVHDDDEERARWITWLEKQGEQKPADKVEPRFHVGEWIIHQGTENIYQVVAIVDNQYQLKYGDNYTTQYCEDVDRCTRLWDVAKDAKDGDVLVSSSGKPFIFKGFFDNDPMAYGGLVADDSFWPASNSNWTTVYCKPATKEQRDLLFQKMKEAGYEWDAEKKELKKISQRMISAEAKEAMYDKPAWSEEDESILNTIIGALSYMNKMKQLSTGSYDKQVNWLKSLKDRYTWKPSDEQMLAINTAINVLGKGTINGKYLIELHEQLLKLKG